MENTTIEEELNKIGDEIYNLNDKLSEIVANKVKNIKSDHEFNSLISEFEVTLAGFKKDKGTTTVTIEDPSKVIKQAVASATVETPKIPNSQTPVTQETPAERAKKAFSKEKIVISV